jgi:hypothetical protein
MRPLAIHVSRRWKKKKESVKTKEAYIREI